MHCNHLTEPLRCRRARIRRSQARQPVHEAGLAHAGVADDADDERPPIPLFAGDDDVDGQPDASDDGAADSAPKSGLF